MKKIILTNTYEQRKKSTDIFIEECTAIFNEVRKVTYRGVKGVSIALSEVFVHRNDSNMLYAHIAILNMDTRRCVLLEPRSDGTLNYWKYKLESEYKNAEYVLRSRFMEHQFPINGEKGEHDIDIEIFFSTEIPFNDFLQFPLPVDIE